MTYTNVMTDQSSAALSENSGRIGWVQTSAGDDIVAENTPVLVALARAQRLDPWVLPRETPIPPAPRLTKIESAQGLVECLNAESELLLSVVDPGKPLVESWPQLEPLFREAACEAAEMVDAWYLNYCFELFRLVTVLDEVIACPAIHGNTRTAYRRWRSENEEIDSEKLGQTLCSTCRQLAASYETEELDRLTLALRATSAAVVAWAEAFEVLFRTEGRQALMERDLETVAHVVAALLDADCDEIPEYVLSLLSRALEPVLSWWVLGAPPGSRFEPLRKPRAFASRSILYPFLASDHQLEMGDNEIEQHLPAELDAPLFDGPGLEGSRTLADTLPAECAQEIVLTAEDVEAIRGVMNDDLARKQPTTRTAVWMSALYRDAADLKDWLDGLSGPGAFLGNIEDTRIVTAATRLCSRPPWSELARTWRECDLSDFHPNVPGNLQLLDLSGALSGNPSQAAGKIIESIRTAVLSGRRSWR